MPTAALAQAKAAFLLVIKLLHEDVERFSTKDYLKFLFFRRIFLVVYVS
jgi:hypothetical protein